MKALNSSWVTGSEYDPEQKILTVQVGGKMYVHEGVPVEAGVGLETAESPGTYYNTQIKNRFPHNPH